MKRILKNENGFTLIEVLASFVILTILITSFFQLFIFSGQVSGKNQNKLAAVNLAKSTMERMKIDPDSFIDPPAKNPPYMRGAIQTFDASWCKPGDQECLALFKPLINGKMYDVKVEAKQTGNDKNLKLISILVTVKLPETTVKSEVEGYISYE